jgi:DNA repair exonuclease SbcCD ATPase subunit
MDILAQDNSVDLGSQKEAKKLAQKEAQRVYDKKRHEDLKENLSAEEWESRKAAKRLYAKQYRENNKDKVRESNKAWCDANKDKLAEHKKAYREGNKDKISERGKAYRKGNKDKLAEHKKAYHQTHKEDISEQKRKYYIENKDKIAERNKAYRDANKDKIAEQNKAWRDANKDKIVELGRTYRHANRNTRLIEDKRRRDKLAIQNDQTITPDFITELFSKAKSCPYCGKKMFDVSKNQKDAKSLDHLIPISKGGLHSVHNVAICCHSCNSKKRDLSFPEWLDRLEEPWRTKAEKLYTKQYGTSSLQGVLPLIFES